MICWGNYDGKRYKNRNYKVCEVSFRTFALEQHSNVHHQQLIVELNEQAIF
jgi:hypothetical protein